MKKQRGKEWRQTQHSIHKSRGRGDVAAILPFTSPVNSYLLCVSHWLRPWGQSCTLSRQKPHSSEACISVYVWGWGADSKYREMRKLHAPRVVNTGSKETRCFWKERVVKILNRAVREVSLRGRCLVMTWRHEPCRDKPRSRVTLEENIAGP